MSGAQSSRTGNGTSATNGCGRERPALCQCGCGEPAPIAAKTDSRRGTVAGQPLRYINGHNPPPWKGRAKRPGEGGYHKREPSNGNGRFHLYPEGTAFIGQLAPGTRFKAGTTDGEVVDQRRVCKETVVKYQRYGSKHHGARVRSVWPASVRVEVVA